MAFSGISCINTESKSNVEDEAPLTSPDNIATFGRWILWHNLVDMLLCNVHVQLSSDIDTPICSFFVHILGAYRGRDIGTLWDSVSASARTDDVFMLSCFL